MISIFNRESKGWQILAHRLAKKRVNGSELAQKLLNMINWKKFQDMALQNQILADPMKLIRDNFVDNILSMGDVVMKIIDPKAAKNMLQGNVILRNIISMIKAIY